MLKPIVSLLLSYIKKNKNNVQTMGENSNTMNNDNIETLIKELPEEVDESQTEAIPSTSKACLEENDEQKDVTNKKNKEVLENKSTIPNTSKTLSENILVLDEENTDLKANVCFLDNESLIQTPSEKFTNQITTEDYQADVSANTTNNSENIISSTLNISDKDEDSFLKSKNNEIEFMNIFENATEKVLGEEKNGIVVFNLNNDFQMSADIAEESKKRDLMNQHNERNEPTSLVIDETIEEQEVRSDGSDSGLGSETSTAHNSSENNNSLNIQSPSCKRLGPLRSNLKRRFADNIDLTNSKKQKRSIQFNNVHVYYFPRIQGFACVPSQGGCTLGMGNHHVNCKTFTLAEHAAEQRRVHKQQMQEINPRSSSSDETDSDEEISEASGSDLDVDSNGFLQPVSTRQRRALLKVAGIRKVDSSEKDDCKAIRSSREFCGCSCRGFCDPDTCSCSQAGIKCQVDRPNFPCGCTRDGCANIVGRVEFNPSRVRTHYIHTIMRLELENKQGRPERMNSTYLSYSDTNSSHLNMVTASSSNSLSNPCSFNSINSNYCRPQAYGQLHIQPHTNQNYRNSNFLNSYHESNDYIPHDSTNLMHPSVIHTNCSRLNNNPTMDMANQNSNFCHPINLNYSYRQPDDLINIEKENSLNEFGGIGTPPIYDSFVQISNESNNYASHVNPTTHSISSYSSFQDHFLNFSLTSCNSNCNNNLEIHDLTTNEDEPSSYINLHPPTGNLSRLNAINDLLQNTRNSSMATISTTVASLSPIKTSSTLSLAVSCNLASSAQMSTCISESTLTTISPAKNCIVNNMNIESQYPDFVDLTNEHNYKDKNNFENSIDLSSSLESNDIPVVSLLDKNNDKNFRVISPAPTCSNENKQCNLKSSESDENLCDILKKSIAETVSA